MATITMHDAYQWDDNEIVNNYEAMIAEYKASNELES
jgi:phosphodiesterase/alkaline phosphatase D-like protein